jgi:hypothetical protein
MSAPCSARGVCSFMCPWPALYLFSTPHVQYETKVRTRTELELELIQTRMTQKPMLRAEVCANHERTKQLLIEMIRSQP